MNEIQKVCQQIDKTRERQKLIIRWAVIPFVVIYLTAYAYIILIK